MQHQIYDNEFTDQDQRYPEHELQFVGLVTNQQHGQIHRGCTAERGDQQQGVFFHTPIPFDGGMFIMDRHDDGDDIDDD